MDQAAVQTNYEYKSGGKIKSRWIDYLNYKRKAESDSQKHFLEHEKLENARFKRELDALDKETLLLLRAVFS